MRELDLLVRGMLAGLAIAAPVGPVNILCIQRTLTAGRTSGIVSGLGAAVVDMLYGAVAGFSITLVIDFLLREKFWIRTGGGVLLLLIGLVYFFKPSQKLGASQGRHFTGWSDFRTVFLLTLTNPTTILTFLALLTALGLAQHRPWWLTFFLVMGIFCGSMLWWIVLSTIVSHFRNRFNDQSLVWMNRAAAVAIGALGIAQFVLAGS